MKRRKTYRLPASTRGGSGYLYGILALLLLAGLVWIWRQTGGTPAAKPVAPKPRASAVDPAVPMLPRIPPPVPAEGRTSPPVVNLAPSVPASQCPRSPQNTFEAQLVLARLGISSGSIDGVAGSQTRAALLAFQKRERLPLTGTLDAGTRARLVLETPALASFVVTSNELGRLQPIANTWLGKSQQSALEYETLLELVAEKFHAHPGFIRMLNPGVNWSNLIAGTELRVPDAAYPEPKEKAAFIRISLAGKTLQAFGAQSNLLAHFPCSIARRVEKRPVGELRVVAIAPNPDYTFNPEVFPESTEAQAIGRKLMIPPGPNNPVGTAWISLDRPGYGMHGTPNPEQVGRTESHGCFRLANWNAEYLLKLVNIGTPVLVEP